MESIVFADSPLSQYFAELNVDHSSVAVEDVQNSDCTGHYERIMDRMMSAYNAAIITIKFLDSALLHSFASIIARYRLTVRVAWRCSVFVGAIIGVIAGIMALYGYLLLALPLIAIALQLSRLDSTHLLQSASIRIDSLFSKVDRGVKWRLRRLKEFELIARGYRLSHGGPLPPISRIERSSETIRCRRTRKLLSRCVGQLLNRYRALIGKLAVDNNSYDDIDAADDLSLKSIDDRLRLLRSANKQCVDELQSLKQDELDLLDWADGSTSDGVELVEHVLLLHSELQSITGQLCAKHPITEFWQDLLVTYNGGGNNESVSVNQTDAVRATAGISAVVNTLHSIEYKLSLLASDPSSPEICESVGLAMNILSNDWQNLQRSLLADGPTEETNECDQKRSIDPKQPLITFENANQKSDAADVEKTQINNIVEVVYESGETVEITAASDQPSVKLSRTERIALMKQRQREEEEIKRQREARIQLSQQILTELQSVIRLKPQTAAPS